MFSLTKPTATTIKEFHDQQRHQPFTYKEVGITRRRWTDTPLTIEGYNLDHNRVRLGSGRQVFDTAVSALKQWKQFELGWVEVCTPERPILENEVVCLCLPIFGFLWTLFACRIVYTVDETVVDPENGPVQIFGFAYGTLAGHPESGEESFTVEWRHNDDSVWYELVAYSRPGSPFVQLGRPYARYMQKKFAKDSKQAMTKFANASIAK